jgi:hypothetical protein
MTLCSNPKAHPAFERLLDLHSAGFRKSTGQQWESSIRGDRRKPGKRLSRTQIDELAAGYEAGSTVYELSLAFGIQRQTVSKILKREGVPLRRQSLTPEEISVAQDLYSAGLSCQSIGELLECSHGTVRLALVSIGTKMRDSHGRDR